MLTDEERRMLDGAQKAAIEFGNENFRLRAENREMRAVLVKCRERFDGPEPDAEDCPLCGVVVRPDMPHAEDCPFVRFAPEED